MNRTVYEESFDAGPGGWYGIIDNFHGNKPLDIRDGAVHCYSPWWIDYNHAPPGGAGYLHVLMGLYTRGPFTERIREIAGPNRFVQEGYPANFTNAKLTVRIRGELKLRGARLVLLIQGTIEGICSGWMLTDEPINVREDWTEQTITARLDSRKWTCLGARPDRADMYGTIPLKKILEDVNTNIYFVLFPLNVVSMGQINGDPHLLRAGRDYHVWQSELPEGYVMVDTVKIEFP